MNNSAKIAIITPSADDACYIYRGFPWELLGYPFEVYAGNKGFNLWHALMSCDVVVMQRPFHDKHLMVARTAKRMNKPLIIDWDDDLTCVPDWNPYQNNFTGCEPVMRELCALADVATVTTRTLAAKMQELGARETRVIKNAIHPAFDKMPLLPRRPIAAWRGSATHAADLDHARPALENLVEKGYQIAFLGDKPSYAHRMKHIFLPVKDYADYMTTLRELAPTYMVVTLEDCAFNRAKSDVAAQEAYWAGAKLLHNGVGEYEGLPQVSEYRKLDEVNHERKAIIKQVVGL